MERQLLDLCNSEVKKRGRLKRKVLRMGYIYIFLRKVILETILFFV